MIKMSDQIKEYFFKKVKNVIPQCKIKVYTELRDIPTATLNLKDDIADYLKKQPTFSYIRIFVDKRAEITEERIAELQDELIGCDGKIYVYFCDNVDDVDINSYDLSSYTYSEKIEKGNY